MAYTVAENALEAIIAGLTDDLTPFEVCAVSVDSIRSAKVSAGGKSAEIGREVKEVSTVNTATGETVTELTEIHTGEYSFENNDFAVEHPAEPIVHGHSVLFMTLKEN
jgi:hypothetical protein